MTDNNKPAASPETAAPRSARDIAETVLGHIDWLDTTEGYCECPGKDTHTTKDGGRDCIVFLDRVPTVHCVHASCERAVKNTNRKLRQAVLNGTDEKPRQLTADEKAKLAERHERERLRIRAAKALPRLLETQAWAYEKICAESPVKLPSDAAGHWRLLLEKFNGNDVVWIGDKFDSGKPEHARHFKMAADWLKGHAAPGPFICPAVFKNTSHARSNDNVLTRRFLVVESDVLTKDQVGAVFKWMKNDAKQELIAIVDTAGKSLHGWFRYPPEDQLDHLKTILPAYGCDPKLFTASQPVRLPGALRDVKYQKLVYLSNGGAE